MNYRISVDDKSIRGSVTLPSSKSISNRLLIIRALCPGGFSINNLSDAGDTKLLLELLSSPRSHYDAGDAGTVMRFLTAYLAAIPGEWTITGSERMMQRPIGPLVDSLRLLGAGIDYMTCEGYPPLRITGTKLKGGKVFVDGTLSSQFISAMMLIAPMIEGGLEIIPAGKISSQPYIEMTVGLMQHFGAGVRWDGRKILVEEKPYRGREYTVESDWSAASYWYEVAALSPSPEIFLEGLNRESIQGDSAVAFLFESFGIQTDAAPGGVHISRAGSAVSGSLSLDFSAIPDLAQTIFATSAMMGVRGKYTGLESLRIKETDRLEAMDRELGKTGAKLFCDAGNVCRLEPASVKSGEQNPVFETYGDHRMAMALAPLALRYKSITIKDAEVVSKSYPAFWKEFRKAGFRMDEVPG